MLHYTKVQRRLLVVVETRLKPIDKLQSNFSKHVDNVARQNSNGSDMLYPRATDALNTV